jgi:AcrR family transcriptional regulator
MRDANCDPGAVHYHFGGREALAAAVLDRTLVPLNNRRLELLTELDERGRLSVAALVEALIRPDVEAAQALEGRGRGRARLIGAIYLYPAAFVTKHIEQRFGVVADRFHPYLIATVPAVAPDVLAWRIRWCLFGTLGALLTDPNEILAAKPDELIHRFVTTIAPAIAAPTKLEEES